MSNAPFFYLNVSSIGIIPQQSNFPSAIDGAPNYPWVANISSKALPFVLISNNPNDNPDYRFTNRNE